MKSSARALMFIAAIGTLVSPLEATRGCTALNPGQNCTAMSGQDSRCSRPNVCITANTCDSNLKLLQRCSTRYSMFCYPLFDGMPLQCLEPADISTVVQVNACANLTDGAPCKSAFTDLNGEAGPSATVYELNGVCEKSNCIKTIDASCTDKAPNTSCTFEDFENGDVMQFNGTCRSYLLRRNMCEKAGSGAFIRPAKVLIANAPISSTLPSPTPESTLWSPPAWSPPSTTIYESSSSGGGLSTRFIIGIVVSALSFLLCFIRIVASSSKEEEAATTENSAETPATAYGVAVEEGQTSGGGWGTAVRVQNSSGVEPMKKV